MATVLKNIVSFTGLVAGVPAVLPHGLNINGIPVEPQLGGGNTEGFTITADDTNITVTRKLGTDADSVDVYVEHWHTIEEALPLPGKLAGKTPFFFGGSGQNSDVQVQITFRPFDPGAAADGVYGNNTDPDGGWAECYAAVREQADRGVLVGLMFDFQFCPALATPVGGAYRLFTLPAGLWDMRSVQWLSWRPREGFLFADGCVVEGTEILTLDEFAFVNNSYVSTPFIQGGISPFGNRPASLHILFGRIDPFNTVPGCKPLFKLGGNQTIAAPASVFTSMASAQFVGPNSFSPMIDASGQALQTNNLNFENNTITSLAGTLMTAPTTTLTAPVDPGATTIPVVSTAAFPAAGVVNLNNNYTTEAFTYTSKDATNFFGVTPVKGSFYGPSAPALGAAVIAPTAVNIGATTIPVVSTAGFPAVGAVLINGGEIVTYTSIDATNFLGCSPLTKAYPRGWLVEPVRAVSPLAVPVGTTTLNVNNTAGFPAAGSLFLYNNGVSETVTYTGKTATSFTGVSATVNAYGPGALMEIASSFRGGTWRVHRGEPAETGRTGTFMWQMPMLDLSTLAVLPTEFGGNGNLIRTKKIIRTNAPISPTTTTTVGALAIGATSITVADGSSFPTGPGVLVLNNGTAGETVRYTSRAGNVFSGVTALVKAYAGGVDVNYGGTYGEMMLINGTTAAVVQLPTAKRSYGDEFTVKESFGGAGGITVIPFTGQTIDGAASDVIAGAFGARKYISDGQSGWLIAP